MRASPIAFLLLACEGGDTNFQRLYPELVIYPESLDFGEVVVDYADRETISIANEGRAELELDEIEFTQTSTAFSADFKPAVLEPGDIETLEVQFAPPTYVPYTGTLTLYSNDPDRGAAQIELLGEGVDGPVPDIALDALTVEFGEVVVGSTDQQLLEIRNEGEGDLVLGTVTLEGDSTFSLSHDLTGVTVDGDSVTNVLVSYTPTDEEGDSATLTLDTNDPDEDPVVVIFLGNGGGDFEYPQAIIDCPEEVVPPSWITLDGSASYDPNGYELAEYVWWLERAPAEHSEAEVIDNDLSADVWVPIAGQYSVGLYVVNSIMTYSDPTYCEFEAIPDDDIHVELIWDTDDSDLDLHLIQAGYAPFDEHGDACYCNRNPDWGDSGDETDDPTLDLDDMFGYGPENINIEDPAENTYTILVHYYSDGGGGTTVATVNIYLWGALVATDAELLTETDAWTVGTISWPDGTVTLSDEALDTIGAGETGCRSE